MEPYRHFEDLINSAKKLNVHKDDRFRVINELLFFRQQSLCDYDRRESMDKLRPRWVSLQSFMNAVDTTGLFKRDESFWIGICDVTGWVKPEVAKSYVRPNIPPIVSKSPANPFKDFNETNFFEHLVKYRPAIKCANKYEELFIHAGLLFMLSESKHNRGKRDKLVIQRVWRELHPLLEKHGLLEPYRVDPRLIEKVRFFIKDGF